jgi:AcrR family transcriptional regulator
MFVYISGVPRVKTISDEAVLEQALAVMLERGPRRFTLPEVGHAVGLSPSTLIQRFGSKRRLMDRVFEHATASLERELEALPDTGDPRSDLIDWLVDLARPLRTRDQVAASLTMVVIDITEPARRAMAQRHIALIRRGIAAYLSALGSPAPEAQAEVVEAYWGGLSIQWAMSDAEEPLEDWLRRGMAALLQALLPATER